MANVRSLNIENQQGRVMLQLFGTFLGGALILNSFILQLFEKYKDSVYLCAFLGAIMLGAPVVMKAFSTLLRGKLKMTELAGLAVIASFSLGEYQTAGLVAFFMLLSEQLESRTALGARAAIAGLIKLAPEEACRIKPDGKEERIPAKDLNADDIVRIRPGENIPADGEVIKGHSAIRQAEITGESLPVEKGPGSEVFAGTNNLTGMIEIKVTKVGKSTTLGKVRQLILQAESTKIPIMQLIDKHVGWYTPTIIMLAGLILFLREI